MSARLTKQRLDCKFILELQLLRLREASQRLGMPAAALGVPWVRPTDTAGSVRVSLDHSNHQYFFLFQKHDT